ncbi:MAG: methyltransferase [Pseudomonadota bacterium]
MMQAQITLPLRRSLMRILCALVFFSTGTVQAELDERTAAALDAAIESSERPDADKARDRNRKPKATLEFFGFRDDMAVAEIFPGPGGWYTKILAPALKEHGQLHVISGLYKQYGYGDALSRVDALDGKDQINTVDISTALIVNDDFSVSMNDTPLAANDLDLVLTFRNLHNMTPEGRMALYRSVYAALKEGGRFGAIDHTRRHMMPNDPEMERRLDPVIVIKEATAAGFTFVDFSTLHYRPDDELRYEVGRRSVTGNTDRWTLMFQK